jgi:hypothetical protein
MYVAKLPLLKLQKAMCVCQYVTYGIVVCGNGKVLIFTYIYKKVQYVRLKSYASTLHRLLYLL